MEQIPDKVTPEWIASLEADGWSKREQAAMIKKARENEAVRLAQEKLDTIDQIKRDRRNDALHDLTEEEIDQCALLSVDPDKGLKLAAAKLNRLIDLHTQPREGQRKGNINTLMDYILAHIFLLEDTKLSKKPIHDLRRVNTEEDAAKCGISHRNLALIWKCILSMEKNITTLIGQEDHLAQLARDYTREALNARKEEKEAQQTLSRSAAKKQRLQYASNARQAFNIPPVNSQVQTRAADRGNENSVDFSVYEGDEARIADRGSRGESEEERIANENKGLIKKLGG